MEKKFIFKEHGFIVKIYIKKENDILNNSL